MVTAVVVRDVLAVCDPVVEGVEPPVDVFDIVTVADADLVGVELRALVKDVVAVLVTVLSVIVLVAECVNVSVAEIDAVVLPLV